MNDNIISDHIKFKCNIDLVDITEPNILNTMLNVITQRPKAADNVIVIITICD